MTIRKATVRRDPADSITDRVTVSMVRRDHITARIARAVIRAVADRVRMDAVSTARRGQGITTIRVARMRILRIRSHVFTGSVSRDRMADSRVATSVSTVPVRRADISVRAVMAVSRTDKAVTSSAAIVSLCRIVLTAVSA